jgi:anti-sigma B factor antagonist
MSKRASPVSEPERLETYSPPLRSPNTRSPGYGVPSVGLIQQPARNPVAAVGLRRGRRPLKPGNPLLGVPTGPHGNYLLLTVSGDLDLATKDRFAEQGIDQLLEPGVVLVLDLGQVTFIDATSLGSQVRLRNVAGHVRKQLLLTQVPLRVQRLLGLTGLDAYFEQQLADPGYGIDALLRREVDAA